MKFPCRKIVGASVIMLMALASVAPRGYSHSHEATPCREHEHSHQGHSHAHDHIVCHRHCHATAQEESQAVMLSPHSHRHLFWWGLEFVLPPLPTNESGDAPGDFDGAQLSLLASRPSEAVVEMTAPPVVVPTMLLALASELVPITAHLAAAAAQRPESNLLCDSARHERSGVLLI